MASFAEQGSVVLPQYQSHVQDYGTLYATIGSQLNQQHLANKQAWLTNIITPLSQVQSREIDRGMLNEKKSEYTDAVYQFAQNNDWSKAGSFIMDMTAKFLTDEGLKLINQAYAQEQAFIKEVNESEHSQEYKQAAILQAKLSSKPITLNPDGKTYSGGFTPVPIGEKFDYGKLMTDLRQVAQDITAEMQTNESFISNPEDLVNKYGLSTLLGVDGQTISSHIAKITSKTEQITPDRVMSVLLDALNYRKDYNAALIDENSKKLFMHRLVKDETSPNGVSVRNLTFQDYVDLVSSQDKYLVAVAGLTDNKGEKIQLNKLVSYDNHTRRYTVNANYDSKYAQSINDKYKTIDPTFDILKILTGENGFNPEIESTLIENYFNNKFKNISSEEERSSLFENIILKTLVEEDKYDLVKSFGNTYKKYSVTTDTEFIENPMFDFISESMLLQQKHLQDKALENLKLANKRAEESQASPNFHYTANTSVVLSNYDYKKSFDEYLDVRKNINQVTENINSIILPTGLDEVLGVGNRSVIDYMRSINLASAINMIENNTSLSDADKDVYRLSVNNLYASYRILESLEEKQLNLQSIYNDIFRQASENNLLNNTQQYIYDNGIWTVDDYNKIKPVDPEPSLVSMIGQGVYSTDNSVEVRKRFYSDDKFQGYLRDSITDLAEKLHDKGILKSDAIDTHIVRSKATDDHMKTIGYFKDGFGDAEVYYNGEVVSDTVKEKLKSLTGYDSRKQSMSGDKVTRDLTATSKNIPLTTKGLGFKGKYYKIRNTELVFVRNAKDMKEGYNTYHLNIYDTPGQLRDVIVIRKKTDPFEIFHLVAKEFSDTAPLFANPQAVPQTLKDQRDASVNLLTNSLFAFEVTDKYTNKTHNIGNIKELTTVVDGLKGKPLTCKLKFAFDPTQDRQVEFYKDGDFYYLVDEYNVANGVYEYNGFGYNGYHFTTGDAQGQIQPYTSLTDCLNQIMYAYLISF